MCLGASCEALITRPFSPDIWLSIGSPAYERQITTGAIPSQSRPYAEPCCRQAKGRVHAAIRGCVLHKKHGLMWLGKTLLTV